MKLGHLEAKKIFCRTKIKKLERKKKIFNSYFQSLVELQVCFYLRIFFKNVNFFFLTIYKFLVEIISSKMSGLIKNLIDYMSMMSENSCLIFYDFLDNKYYNKLFPFFLKRFRVLFIRFSFSKSSDSTIHTTSSVWTQNQKEV